MKTTLIPFCTTRPSLLGEFPHDFSSLLNQLVGYNSPSSLGPSFPLTNLSETDTGYEVSIDLPGLSAEEIEVELKHGDLWITGERKQETEEKGKTYHCTESHFGKFQRVVRLGDDVDSKQVDAQYRDGVLRVVVPKLSESGTKRVEVKS